MELGGRFIGAHLRCDLRLERPSREWETRKVDLGNAEIDFANLAHSLVQHADDTFEIADTILIGLVHRLEIDRTGPDAIARRQAYLPARKSSERICGTFIYAATGATAASTAPRTPGRGRLVMSVRSAGDYLQGFGERIGYPLSIDEWVEARRRSMRANHAILNIASRLRSSIDIAVLTNNTTLVADHIDTLLPELRPLFGSRIYTSAQFKVAKPDPRCYGHCLSELDLRPETVLFVDDLLANVVGARKAGLFAHHHTSTEAFRQALSEHGLLRQ